ncbi:BnaA10g11780D [Brassica napus]|uniref:BnaA10g11780D protein n=1 Tax=Brassica napus TaxID=3708 RepID=A0A078IJN5_BRANA|nr:BnaA10g11780D [Brassica napus]
MEGSLVLALLLHEASFPIIGTNYKTLDGTCVAAASQRNLMHFYFDNDGGVSSNYLKKNQSSFALRSSIALTQHTDGAISHFRSATANCNVDSQLFHAMHVDNADGVVRSSTPRVCPIQPDSDIGEELAEEKGRSPMKSPKD